MPLDPSIILRGIPPPTPVQSPLEVLSVIEQMRNRRESAEAQRAATEERRLAGEERRQKAAEEAAARQRAAAVEQRVQGALIMDPTTGRPTLDWAKLLEGGEVPSATIFKLGEETDQVAQRLATLRSTNMDIKKKNAAIRGALALPVVTAGYAKPAWDAAVLASFNEQALTAEERDAGFAMTDPAQIKVATDNAITLAGLLPKPSELQKVTKYDPATGQTVETFVTPTEGAEFVQPPPKPSTPAYQQKDVLLDGKPAIVTFDSHSGKSFVGDQDVTARVRPIPPQPPQGPGPERIVSIIGPDGKPIYVRESAAVGQRPGTASADRPATEGERKAAGFYSQMQGALTTINQLEAQLSSRDLYQIQSLPQEGFMGAVNRGQMSDAAKRYIQAFNQFTEARLRPVSGAAIADSEYARDRATYGKQYAETGALATQRMAARKAALDSLRVMAGSALEGAASPPPPDPLTVTTPDGTVIRFDTPAQVAAFKQRTGLP